jgi:hypothetical protein
MTGADFDALRPFLLGRISDDRVSAARLALVDGQTLQGVASIYGWTRQAVGDAVGVVWRIFEQYQESQAVAQADAVPAGWKKVTLVAPVALIEKFRAEIAESGATLTVKASKKKPARAERAG